MKRIRQPQHVRKKPSPERSFEHGVSLLNNAELNLLWKISARVALHNAFTRPDHPLFLSHTLNSEKIRLFDQMIIASRASTEKRRVPSLIELRNVLDDCTDASFNPHALNRLMQANNTERIYVEFQRFLTYMANIQFPQQDCRPRLQAGRTIGMFEVLPSQYSHFIPADRRKQVEAVLEDLHAFLGVSLVSIAECFLATLEYQKLPYAVSLRELGIFMDGFPQFTDNNMRLGIMIDGLLSYEPESTLDEYILFSPERLLKFLRIEPPSDFLEAMKVFLSLFSATTDELRTALRQRKEFEVGFLSDRLSPLERYPVVHLETESKERTLLVPNVLHLMKSFGTVIDSALLAQFGNRYNEVRGILQEIYLRCLVEDRLPELVTIPEVTYKRGSEARGPDLTLIDESRGRIILVESKGRRITLSTRLTMESEIFKNNLEDVYGALLKLPGKLADLYAGKPEYSQYQAAIDSTRGSTPVFVVVLSEGVYFMSHVIRLQALDDPTDPLHDFDYKFCVMSLDRFEYAVEIALRHRMSLYDILEGHWKRSGERDFERHHADALDGIFVDEEGSFAMQFAPSEPSWRRG